MSSISLHDIGLKPASLKAVKEKAKHAGKTPPEYVRWLIERDLLAEQSFDEILRPVRRDVRNRGLSSDQLDTIIERARVAAAPKVRRARR